MGRDWISHLEVNLKHINAIESDNSIQKVLQKVLHKFMFTTVFNDDLGCLQGTTVKLQVHDDAQPKFYKPRPVPLLLKEKVEQELEALQEYHLFNFLPGQHLWYLL